MTAKTDGVARRSYRRQLGCRLSGAAGRGRGSFLRLCRRAIACTTLGLNCFPEQATISFMAVAMGRPGL